MAKQTQIWWKYDATEPPPEEFPSPGCFSKKEWATYFEAEKQAIWNAKSLSKAIWRDMCGDCDLKYQLEQESEGKCHPVRKSHTPRHRGQNGS